MAVPCPSCGQANHPTAAVCVGCGLRLAIGPSEEDLLQAAGERRQRQREAALRHNRLGWIAIGCGVILSPLVYASDFARFCGWILASIVHELGHTVMGWAAGHVTVPAVNPFAGHAVAHTLYHLWWLPWLIWAALAVLSWRWWREGHGWPWLALALFYPCFVWWEPLRETLFLYAGHGGELAFGAWLLWRARLGISAHEDWQRPLYGIVGAWLVASNAVLGFGLMINRDLLMWYLRNNFGENDLQRIARDIWGTSINLPALVLGLGSILVPLVVLWLAEVRRRRTVKTEYR